MDLVSAPPSQTDQILAHLKAGNVITPLDALAKFHCFRLAARINELRLVGYDIVTGVRTLTTGKKIAEYRLNRRED